MAGIGDFALAYSDRLKVESTFTINSNGRGTGTTELGSPGAAETANAAAADCIRQAVETARAQAAGAAGGVDSEPMQLEGGADGAAPTDAVAATTAAAGRRRAPRQRQRGTKTRGGQGK